jgi:hypothetical protein
MITKSDLIGKKGILIISTPRSGSHMLASMVYNILEIENKVNLGEIYCHDVDKLDILQHLKNIELSHAGEFIIASIVQYYAINLLIPNQKYFKDYYLIDLRRRDKIAQYASWCIFQKTGNFSPNPESYKHLLPLPVDIEHVERFIASQNFCYAIPAHKILYYEEVVNLNLPSSFTKNHYPIDIKDIFSDYEVIYKLLGNYQYHE